MQLINPSDFCKDSINFLEATSDKNGNKNIKIRTTYLDNKRGPLLIESPWLFSFGVNERKNHESDEMIGYSLPICLWKKGEEPTKQEKEFLDCITTIEELCYNHVEEIYGVEIADQMREILYYKESELNGLKNRDDSIPPILYSKLIYSKKDEKIYSLFRMKGDGNVDPMKFFGKYCPVKLVLDVDSIFIGNDAVSVQLKAREVYVKPQKEMTPLLVIEESEDEE